MAGSAATGKSHNPTAQPNPPVAATTAVLPVVGATPIPDAVWVDDLGLELVPVKAGSFQMGSDDGEVKFCESLTKRERAEI